MQGPGPLRHREPPTGDGAFFLASGRRPSRVGLPPSTYRPSLLPELLHLPFLPSPSTLLSSLSARSVLCAVSLSCLFCVRHRAEACPGCSPLPPSPPSNRFVLSRVLSLRPPPSLAMPSFFQFTQGTESRVRPPAHDTSPLLGRFRAVPPRPGVRRRSSQLGLLADASRGSVHVGYGAAVLIAAGLADGSDDDDSDEDGSVDSDDDGNGFAARWGRRWRRWVVDLWVEPKQTAVKRMVDRWWRRYGLLVFLPAILVRLSRLRPPRAPSQELC